MAVLVVGVLAATVGCEETKQLRMENQSLLEANAELRAKNRNIEDSNASLQQRIQGMDVQMAEKDSTIARLQQTVNTPPPPPPTPTPPIDNTGGNTGGPSGTGFEGTDSEVTSSRGMVTVTIAGDLLFDSGKATLKSSAKANLNKIAGVLKDRYAGKAIRVRGHSDSDPIRKSGWKDNYELSRARAKSVADYLVSQGVDRGRIELVALANTEPRVSPEKTSADKAKNRRVDIQVVTSGG